MSTRPVIRPPRVPKRRSRVATALFLLAGLIVGSAVTAVLYLPTSLEEFAWSTAIVAVFEGTGWAISSLWERLTRKRRRASLSG